MCVLPNFQVKIKYRHRRIKKNPITLFPTSQQRERGAEGGGEAKRGIVSESGRQIDRERERNRVREREGTGGKGEGERNGRRGRG